MAKIIVCHAYYGCDTGCCGHSIEVNDRRIDFSFDHPEENEDIEKWMVNILQDVKKRLTAEFGEDHLKDVDWDNCIICDYKNCHF